MNKTLGICLAVLVGAGFAWSPVTDAPVVKAQRFVLTDASGAEVGSIGTTKGGDVQLRLGSQEVGIDLTVSQTKTSLCSISVRGRGSNVSVVTAGEAASVVLADKRASKVIQTVSD